MRRRMQILFLERNVLATRQADSEADSDPDQEPPWTTTVGARLRYRPAAAAAQDAGVGESSWAGEVKTH